MDINELKNMPQWVGWNAETRNGKITKVPKNPHNGQNASSINPATWSMASQAWQSKGRYGWSGIGFVFTIERGVVGVDLDNCFDEDGELLDWALDVVLCLNSYTESSPSGSGLHILCRGEIPCSINKSSRSFEMYNEARYFTVTGKIFCRELTSPNIEKRTKELTALYVTFTDDKPEIKLPNIYQQNRNVTEASVKDALATIPIKQDYYDWLRMLMAVHDVFPGGEGVTLIEAWSPGYKGEVARKFRSFNRTAKNGVTINTLFHVAKSNGYQPQRKKYNHKLTSGEKNGRLMSASIGSNDGRKRSFVMAS